MRAYRQSARECESVHAHVHVRERETVEVSASQCIRVCEWEESVSYVRAHAVRCACVAGCAHRQSARESKTVSACVLVRVRERERVGRSTHEFAHVQSACRLLFCAAACA